MPAAALPMSNVRKPLGSERPSPVHRPSPIPAVEPGDDWPGAERDHYRHDEPAEIRPAHPTDSSIVFTGSMCDSPAGAATGGALF